MYFQPADGTLQESDMATFRQVDIAPDYRRRATTTGLLAVRLDGDAPSDLWRYDKGFAD